MDPGPLVCRFRDPGASHRTRQPRMSESAGAGAPIFEGSWQALAQLLLGIALGLGRRAAQTAFSVPEIGVQVEQPDGRRELAGGDVFEPRMLQQAGCVRTRGLVVREDAGDIQ